MSIDIWSRGNYEIEKSEKKDQTKEFNAVGCPRCNNNDEDHGYLYTRLKRFTEEVSVLGVRQAFDSTRTLRAKFLWALLVLLGFTLAVYQIEDRISYYLSHPRSTEVNIVQAKSLRFPQVTVCNENFYRRSVARSLGKFICESYN